MKGLCCCDIICKLVNLTNKLFWNSVFVSRMLARTWQQTLTLKGHSSWKIESASGTKIADYNHSNYNYLFMYTVFCLVQLFFCEHRLLPKQFTEVTIHFMHILCRGVSRVCTNCWYSLHNPSWNRKLFSACHTIELSMFLSTHIEVILNNQRHQLQFLHVFH